MSRLIFLAVLIIDALVILEILRSYKDVEKKVLWIVVVVFLPIFGPVLYFVIGRK